MNPKSTPLPVVLFGIPFHDVTFAETLAWSEAHMERGRSGYIVTANLDFVMQSHRDPELQRILLEADLVVADGAPLVRLSGWMGPHLRERVTGSDLTPMLAELCARRGWPIFGLGGAGGVAQKAGEVLQARYPGLIVGGTYSPPLADVFTMDHADLLARLRAAKPALLLVAFGSPKQEKWINMHFREWKVPLSIGIGGTLDFLAGTQSRAPRFFQKIGLEWLWRMASNPKRLFKRYFADGVFLLKAVLRYWVLRHGSGGAASAAPAEEVSAGELQDAEARIVPWQPLADLAAGHVRLQELATLAREQALVFDLKGVGWLRSHELGLLVALNKASRDAGRATILWRPEERLVRLLKASRLDAYLSVFARAEDWQGHLRELRTVRRGRVECNAQGVMRLLLPYELTAANLTDYRRLYEAALPPGGEGAVTGWTIHAAHLQFLDSAAMGFLIGLHKAAGQAGGTFQALHWNDMPRRILRIARLEAVLAPP